MSARKIKDAFLAMAIKEGMTFRYTLPFGYSGSMPPVSDKEVLRYNRLFLEALKHHLEAQAVALEALEK